MPRHRVENLSDENRHVILFLAVRPFQVNPPWPSLNMVGGVSPILELDYAEQTIKVMPSGKRIHVLNAPARFRAATFDQGLIMDDLAVGRLPDRTRATDESFGYASGALGYGRDLRPGEARAVYLQISFHAAAPFPALAKGRGTGGEGVPDTLQIQLTGDVTVPPGRIVLHSPLDRPLREVIVNRQPIATFTANVVTLDPFPAEVGLRY